MHLELKVLPADLHATIAQIAALGREPRYLGAVIFGSVARGYARQQSDLDVKSALIELILAPLGGRVPPAENNCDCHVCRGDLARLYAC